MKNSILTFLITILLVLIASPNFAQQSKFQAEKYFEIANKLFDKNDYTNAIIYLDSTILANTEHPEAYAYRGICRFELKLYNEAIIDFDFALQLVPGYAEVFYYRGLAKFELGFKDKACNDWIEAYNLGYKKALKIVEINCEEMLKNKSK
jgi:tetratricopeptide (TPR) repeat protein